MDKLAFPPETDAQKAMYLPLGLVSPLWLAFGGAAAAGAAFYWMARWREATNIEALMAKPAEALAEIVEPALETVQAVAETFVEEVVEPLVEAAPEPVQEVLAAVEPEPVAEPVVEAAPEPEPEAVLEPDDLTRMVGIGPKVAAALAERGVTRFEHIAAWTAEDIAEVEKTLKLMGRVEREKWVAQARRLAGA